MHVLVACRLIHCSHVNGVGGNEDSGGCHSKPIVLLIDNLGQPTDQSVFDRCGNVETAANGRSQHR
ncbi:hypothetical protein AYO47_03540 [Planctomyces sp. SCGC AG-212-M04]|nr:hypothetical protein AYO47_03540 [Planctomyces sp. SCGC AG-212-M04]